MMTAAMLLFSKIASSGSPIVYIMIPGLLMAAGIGMSIVPSTIAATQGAKHGQAGLASGLVNTSRQVGGGLGIAILITLSTERSSHLIGHGTGVLQSLTEGFRLAYYIGAGLTAAGAIATFLFVPRAAAETGSLLRRFPIAAGIAVVLGAFVALDFAVGGSRGAPLGAYTTSGAYSYVSEPGLHPPIVSYDKAPAAGANVAPGYIFMANFFDVTRPPMVGQSGPLILDSKLQPVWFRPVPTRLVAGNLSLQTFAGKPALAWWQGTITGTGETETGEYVVVNQHYQPVATLRGADGWVLTLHEIVIDGDDAWVTANRNIPMNLSRYGGAYNGSMIDWPFRSTTSRPGSCSTPGTPSSTSRWATRSPRSRATAFRGTPTTSTRSRSPATGASWCRCATPGPSTRSRWRRGGSTGRWGTPFDFRFGPGASFSWQHDVTVYPGTPLITMFDDHCCQITGGGTYVTPTSPSRGLVLKLNSTSRTATLADAYAHDGLDADYMGSMQPLPGGNDFVGWGSAGYFTEYTPTGQTGSGRPAPRPGPDLPDDGRAMGGDRRCTRRRRRSAAGAARR